VFYKKTASEKFCFQMMLYIMMTTRCDRLTDHYVAAVAAASWSESGDERRTVARRRRPRAQRRQPQHARHVDARSRPHSETGKRTGKFFLEKKTKLGVPEKNGGEFAKLPLPKKPIPALGRSRAGGEEQQPLLTSWG